MEIFYQGFLSATWAGFHTWRAPPALMQQIVLDYILPVAGRISKPDLALKNAFHKFLHFLWLVPRKRPSHYAVTLSEWGSEWCNSGLNHISRLWYDTLIGLFQSLITTSDRCVIVLSTYRSRMTVEIYLTYPSLYIRPFYTSWCPFALPLYLY